MAIIIMVIILKVCYTYIAAICSCFVRGVKQLYIYNKIIIFSVSLELFFFASQYRGYY